MEKIQRVARRYDLDAHIEETFRNYNYELQRYDDELIELSMFWDWARVTVRDGAVYVDTLWHGIEKFRFRGKSAMAGVEFIAQGDSYIGEKWQLAQSSQRLLSYDAGHAAHEILDWWEEADRDDEPPWDQLAGASEDDFHEALGCYDHSLIEEGAWGMVNKHWGFMHAVHIARKAIAQKQRFI